jgi:CBS domain-containing protein
MDASLQEIDLLTNVPRHRLSRLRRGVTAARTLLQRPRIFQPSATPGVLSIAPEAALSAAARLMLQNKVSGLPVINGSGKGERLWRVLWAVVPLAAPPEMTNSTPPLLMVVLISLPPAPLTLVRVMNLPSLRRRGSHQIETCRPISTTESGGRRKKSLT